MEAIPWVLKIVGVLVFIVGWWRTLREMFGEERFLGYIGFAVPIVALVYAALHWQDLKGAFCFQAAGSLLLAGGILLEGRLGG